MRNKNRKLRNILINPKYQIRYVLWLSVTGVSLIAMYSTLFYIYTKENYSILVELSPMDDSAKQQLYRELNHIIFLLGGLSTGFLVVVTILGVVMSHRTAGPMFHFKRVFNDIRDGKHSARVRLRPKDDFQDVADCFNQMMDSISSDQALKIRENPEHH